MGPAAVQTYEQLNVSTAKYKQTQISSELEQAIFCKVETDSQEQVSQLV